MLCSAGRVCEELTLVLNSAHLSHLLLPTKERHASGTGYQEEGGGGIQKREVIFDTEYPLTIPFLSHLFRRILIIQLNFSTGSDIL